MGKVTDELLTRYRRTKNGGPSALMDLLIGGWLEEEAQFQDLDPLICELGPVFEALQEHAKTAQPADHPPDFALAGAMYQLLLIGNKMGPRIKNLRDLAAARGKKAAKARTDDEIIRARAVQYRKLDPKHTIPDMALKILEKEKGKLKGNEGGDLKQDTVERKLRRMGFRRHGLPVDF